MGIIKDLNPLKNEIVKIKFKDINKIMSGHPSACFHSISDEYEVADNFKAIMSGEGHFIVSCAYDPIGDLHECIQVTNHMDCNWNFNIREEIIESIEIVDYSERFSSLDHKILVVRIDHEMFINGQPLIWNTEQKEKEEDPFLRKSTKKKKKKEFK